jgi:CheY-like chemotaxis protein
MGEGVPEAIVGDAGRLRQIVLNLLSNAVKFTERGEVVLSVEGKPTHGDNRTMVLEVRDTGIGIPAERMGLLFQSFSQLDASITRRFGGTGLGLAISRRLAEAMGGSLTASSSGIDGEGSTFRLELPATVATLPTAAAHDPALALSLRGRRVLIVDDNATNRRILATLFDRWGMTSAQTASGAEALRWVRDGQAFDVAVLDYLMPEGDGIELAAQLRGLQADRPLPIIILSSVSLHGRSAPGVSAMLMKPAKPSSLHDALATAISGEAMGVRVGAERGAGAAVATNGQAGIAAASAATAGAMIRILLAEDNAVNQKLAIRLLGRMGLEADVVGDGVAALAALDGADYDLVLMDVQMPEMDGLEATRQIRVRWPDRAIRIVGLTANAMAGDRESCLAAGMDDYVSKPIRPEELAAAIARTPALVAAAAGQQA